MFNVGGAEMIFLGFLLLLLFGPQKLPEIARSAGQTMRAFKKAAADVRREMKEALDAEVPPKPARPRPVSPRPEEESKAEAEAEPLEEMRRFPMGAKPAQEVEEPESPVGESESESTEPIKEEEAVAVEDEART